MIAEAQYERQWQKGYLESVSWPRNTLTDACRPNSSAAERRSDMLHLSSCRTTRKRKLEIQETTMILTNAADSVRRLCAADGRRS